MLGDVILKAAGFFDQQIVAIHDEDSLSFRQLIDCSLRIATVLNSPVLGFDFQRTGVTNTGYKPVAIQLGNCLEYPVLVTALAILGIPILPIHTQWSPVEIIRSLGGRPISGLIGTLATLEKWRGHLPNADLKLIEIGKLRELASDAPLLSLTGMQNPSEDAEALCLMTSGTTSAPKLVIRSHKNLLANSENVGEALGWDSATRVLPITPFYHANGFSNGLLLPLLRGASTVLMSNYFPSKLLLLVEKYGVNTLVGSPAVYSSLLQCSNTAEAMAGVKQAISSGGPLPDEVASQAYHTWGIVIRELYGSSESGTISIETADSSLLRRSVGIPVPGVEIAIHSDLGVPLPNGVVGMVAVRSKAVMQGYWSSQGIQSAKDAQGWYHTGDLAAC